MSFADLVHELNSHSETSLVGSSSDDFHHITPDNYDIFLKEHVDTDSDSDGEYEDHYSGNKYLSLHPGGPLTNALLGIPLVKYKGKKFILQTPLIKASQCDFKKQEINLVSYKKFSKVLLEIPMIWITGKKLKVFGMNNNSEFVKTALEVQENARKFNESHKKKLDSGESTEKPKKYVLQFDLCFKYDACGSIVYPIVNKLTGKFI
jgi:hypothetical protein